MIKDERHLLELLCQQPEWHLTRFEDRTWTLG
jgi:hypothetical protein